MPWINKSSTLWCIEETGAISHHSEGYTGCRHSLSQGRVLFEIFDWYEDQASLLFG
jgi:hypothetical protein